MSLLQETNLPSDNGRPELLARNLTLKFIASLQVKVHFAVIHLYLGHDFMNISLKLTGFLPRLT